MTFDTDVARSHDTIPKLYEGQDVWYILADLQKLVASPVDTYWDDLRFPVQGVNPPGAASDPSVNTTTGMLEFAKAATNIIAGVAQMPHRWRQGTNLHPHIHWTGHAAPGGSTDVVWKLEWAVVEIGDTWDGTTYAGSSQITKAVTEDEHLLSEFAEIDMSAVDSVSCHVFWKLSRLGGDGSDDYDDVATLFELDFHYEIDAPGSRLEYTK